MQFFKKIYSESAYFDGKAINLATDRGQNLFLSQFPAAAQMVQRHSNRGGPCTGEFGQGGESTPSPAKLCEKMEGVPKLGNKKDFIFRWRELARRGGSWMSLGRCRTSSQTQGCAAEPLTIKREEEGMK